jgi:hypothetical protein
MFKIEVVAETPEAMAEKLSGLAEIYREGARYLKTRAKVDTRDAAETTTDVDVVDPPKKPSGRKPKPASIELTADKPENAAQEPETKPVALDDVRKSWKDFVDAAAVKSGKEETRREEFKKLLDVFGAAKMSELPEDKWPEAIALGDKKLAEINA